MASDQGLHYSLTGFSIKIELKLQNRSNTPWMTNRLVQYITVEDSTSLQWVKSAIYYYPQRETGRFDSCSLLKKGANNADVSILLKEVVAPEIISYTFSFIHLFIYLSYYYFFFLKIVRFCCCCIVVLRPR